MAKRYDISLIVDTYINSYYVLGEGEPHITKGGYIHRTIICRCKCGKIKTTQLSGVLNHSVKSCGCHSAKIASERAKINNKKHGKYKTPEYNIWCSMKKRCLNETNKSFSDYGGRGITICEDWKNSFEKFITDMGQRPSSLYSIDRIDNNKGYSKDNCRWATKTEQCRNVRNNVNFEYNNEVKCLAEWCNILSLSRYKCINFLIKNGKRTT